jgi:hypothetical protein
MKKAALRKNGETMIRTDAARSSAAKGLAARQGQIGNGGDEK